MDSLLLLKTAMLKLFPKTTMTTDTNSVMGISPILQQLTDLDSKVRSKKYQLDYRPVNHVSASCIHGTIELIPTASRPMKFDSL